MKKVTFLVPDWAEDKNLRLFAGIELCAQRLDGQKMQVKTVRCNFCGECCFQMPETWHWPTVDGRCVNLKSRESQKLCRLGMGRPFSCCAAEPIKREYCCVEWEDVNETDLL